MTMTEAEVADRTDSQVLARIRLPTRTLDGFILCEQLGSGAFSHVVRATDKSGVHEFALKLIRVEAKPGKTDQEYEAMSADKEAFICGLLAREVCMVHCLSAFKTTLGDPNSGRKMHLVVMQMPLMHGSLGEWLKKKVPKNVKNFSLPEAETMGVFVQMLNALRCCHRHGVIHRDIKLDNFMLDKHGMLRLADFGLSRTTDELSPIVAGTAWTMSPSTFLGIDDGFAGDWWSLGVVLYQVSTGGAWPFKELSTFNRKDPEEMEAAIKKAVLVGRILWPSNMPPGVRSLIDGLLDQNPVTRFDLNKVLATACITEALLLGLAARHPPLREDMKELVELRGRVLAGLLHPSHMSYDLEGSDTSVKQRSSWNLHLPHGVGSQSVEHAQGQHKPLLPHSGGEATMTAHHPPRSVPANASEGSSPAARTAAAGAPGLGLPPKGAQAVAAVGAALGAAGGAAMSSMSHVLHGNIHGLTKTRHRRNPSGEALLSGGDFDSTLRDPKDVELLEPIYGSGGISRSEVGLQESVGALPTSWGGGASSEDGSRGGRDRAASHVYHKPGRSFAARLKHFLLCGACLGADDDYRSI